jgi:hypothetical protein
MKEHSFILEPDGKIYWVKDMPEKIKEEDLDPDIYSDGHIKDRREQYNSALQSAIDNAVEVSNQEEVLERLRGIAYPEDVKNDTTYSLLCSVEKETQVFVSEAIDNAGWRKCGEDFYSMCDPKIRRTVALVTFPESGEKIKLFPCGENACALSSSVGGKITACKDKCQLDSGEKQSQEETQEELWKEVLHGAHGFHDDIIKRYESLYTITRK